LTGALGLPGQDANARSGAGDAALDALRVAGAEDTRGLVVETGVTSAGAEDTRARGEDVINDS